MNNSLKICISLLILIIVPCYRLSAQKSINDSSIAFSYAGINYGYMIPGGDMSKRFGNNSSVGGSFSVKLKNSWTFSADGQFLFGNKIKEDNILSGITTDDGKIIGIDGGYADVRYYERGYHFSLNFGRIFTLKKPNPNSGIWVTAGGGFLQHKIRIETIGNNVPELTKDYLKGYDRLSNGFQLREFIGYIYFGKKRLINFYAGFEFIQAFTQNRRDFNFDTKTHDYTKRKDLLNGIRVGWVLPLYKRPPDKFYLY